MEERDPIFFLCSEDKPWRDEFKTFIKNISQNAKIIENKENEEYHGYGELYDFFCLSKCKKIFQSVKHSGFSVIPAMIGQTHLVNYIHKIRDSRHFSINLWKPCVFVNGQKEVDINHQKEIVERWGWNPVYFP